MTTAVLLAVTAALAILDWIAVARENHRLELLAKPLTLVALIAATGFADAGHAKPWLMVALVFGLLGDVSLMFAHEGRTEHAGATQTAFLAGLASFLLGHLSYVVAFAQHGLHGVQLLGGALVVIGVTVLAFPRVLKGAQAKGGRVLAGAVSAYCAALAAMTVLGFGTAAVATAIGALLFLGSDTALAWNRFVRPISRGPLLVIVTYHLAQILIVIGLIR